MTLQQIEIPCEAVISLFHWINPSSPKFKGCDRISPSALRFEVAISLAAEIEGLS